MGTLVFQATLGGSVNLIGPNTASTINFTLPSADGTSGQALTTNGSGTLSFATVTTGAAGSTTQVQYNSSGAFAGSANLTFNGTTLTAANTSITTSETLSYGTANGVTYLNGSKILTSGSALTFDGTNLGVGTSSPSTKLHVSGSGAQYVRLQTTSTNGQTAAYQVYAPNSDGSANAYQVGSGLTADNEWTIQDITSANTVDKYIRGSSGFRAFYQNGTEQMRLTSTGLGIGTSSPAFKLQVTTVSGNWGIVHTAGTASVGTYADSTGGGWLGTYSNHKLNFFTNNGSSQMVLDTAGNLGLGVTPSAWGIGKALQVNNASLMGYLNRLYVNANTYFDGTGTGKYIASDYATSYQQVNGTHAWFNAPSGTAGNAISFTQAMTLDASGRLGIGTTSPTVPLEIAQSATTYTQLRLANTTAGGNGGQVTFAGAGNVDMGWIKCNYPGEMLFGAYNGSSVAERTRIDSAGNFLVGKTSTGLATGIQLEAAGGSSFVRSASTNSDLNLYVYSTGAGAARFYVGMGGTVYATSTTITAISDQRLKENIQDLDVGLDKIMSLKPRKFDWKAGKGKDKKGDRGWIAQEFEQVFPDMVDTWADPAPEGEEPYKAVNADLIPVLVKAIQELKAEFDAYKVSHS